MAELSPRETELMRHVHAGLTTKEAAAAMRVALSTAKEYRERAYAKLGARNTAQALRAFALTKQGDTE